MEKKIEQYLPLYLGQKVQVKSIWDSFVTAKLLAFHIEGNCIVKHITGVIQPGIQVHKLILRPLSSMTEEEKEEMKTLYPHPRETGSRTLPAFEVSKQWAALQTQYLLSKGFDIFNLESSGLAIYEMNDKPETV